MMGLTSIFSAFKRLALAVNRSAELFERANEQFEDRLGVDKSVDDEPKQIARERKVH